MRGPYQVCPGARRLRERRYYWGGRGWVNQSTECRLAVAWAQIAGDSSAIHMASIIDYHRRLRLGEFELVPAAAGRCKARVVLGWDEDGDFVGVAEGADSPSGQLRSAAEATARALETAAGDKVELKVLAVKAIEGFDTIIVVVSLGSRVQNQTERLVGSCLIKGQPARGAVLAVLSATNRLLGRVLAEMRSGGTKSS